MWTFETGLEVGKLAATLLGGIFIVWYWNVQKHALEQYRYLDEAYQGLLQSYFENPQFGDAARTATYRQSFQGDDALRYHFFAMKIHTTMETLFDLSRGKIPAEWTNIFAYHTSLHAQWLKDNTGLHEPGYLALVLRRAARN
jgi:hypothetical protein